MYEVETYCWHTCVCCSSAPHVKRRHCAVTRQDTRSLPTASALCLSSYFMFSGVSAYFFGFSGDMGRNLFSKWFEIEIEHSVRHTMRSYKHMHSEVFSCPAKSCDVRMLWIQCSAQCKACLCLCRSRAGTPMCFTPPKSQHRICLFLVYSGLFCLLLFHFVLCFIVQYSICICSVNFSKCGINELFVHYSVGRSGWLPY